MPADYLICSKCKKSKRETEFFKMKTGDRCDLCKSCLTMHIDNYKPETFMWILEKFNVPYVEDTWVAQCNKQYLKNPGKFGPASVIGQYLRTMNMAQFCEYTFEDTEKLNYDSKKARERIQEEENSEDFAEYEQALLERFEKGEISEAEYNTLSHKGIVTDPEVIAAEEATQSNPGFIEPININDDKIRDELTEDDIKYLALKWGIFYKPSEWVKMEELYSKYATEYELNADREDTLKKICRISLEMDKALDTGDTKTFKDLSSAYDQLRKSAKFTEAQNKEEQVRELDSIGELVAFVEREGGAIPQYEDPIEYPKDKIDFTIRDMQNYVNRLVREELGLGDLIESFIEKASKQKEQSVEDIMNEDFNKTEDDVLTNEEMMTFQDFFMQEIEEESYRLLEEFGEEA